MQVQASLLRSLRTSICRQVRHRQAAVVDKASTALQPPAISLLLSHACMRARTTLNTLTLLVFTLFEELPPSVCAMLWSARAKWSVARADLKFRTCTLLRPAHTFQLAAEGQVESIF